MKTKSIKVKLATIIFVDIPEGSDTETAYQAVKDQLNSLGYSQNSIYLTVDDCEDRPDLVDETF